MDKHYHLFYVADYKGGELMDWPNIDLNTAIDIVYGCWYEDIEEALNILSDESILYYLNSYYDDNYYAYAGGGGRSFPELYVIEEDKLKSVWFTDEQLLNWAKTQIKELTKS